MPSAPLISGRVRIEPGAWHILRLRFEGNRFMAWFNGMPMFEARDAHIVGPGRLPLRNKPPVIEVLY